METIQIVGRVAKYNFNKMSVGKHLRVQTTKGRFTLSKEAARHIGCSTGDSVMFTFNMSEKRAYIFKDDASVGSISVDGFTLNRRETELRFNFTSKMLSDYFESCFGSCKLMMFELGTSVAVRNKTMYPLTLMQDE